MPDALPRIEVFKPRGQCMVMLMAALQELRVTRSKQEVIGFIQTRHWFDIRPDDLDPYPTQTEPRWHTMIAWARKDCVLRGYMFDHDEIDHWEITRAGLARFETHRVRFATGPDQVRKCYLWSQVFKKWMYPAYTPSVTDMRRPQDYLDELIA